MRASLAIEAIGHSTIQMMRVWRGVLSEAGMGHAARAVLGDPSDFARWGVYEVDARGKPMRQVWGRTDYSRANSKGSRGVVVWYALESGKRYFVRSPQSWKNSDEYFCYVNDSGEIVRE